MSSNKKIYPTNFVNAISLNQIHPNNAYYLRPNVSGNKIYHVYALNSLLNIPENYKGLRKSPMTREPFSKRNIVKLTDKRKKNTATKTQTKNNSDPRTRRQQKTDVFVGKCVRGMRGCIKPVALPIAYAAGVPGAPLSIFMDIALPQRYSNRNYDKYFPHRIGRALYSSWAQMANEDFRNKVTAVIKELEANPPPGKKRQLIGKLYRYRDRMHRNVYNKRDYPRHNYHTSPLQRRNIQIQIDKYTGRRQNF